MKYGKIIESVSSGRLNRAQLAKVRRNAEAAVNNGDTDAQTVVDAINISVPSDDYILFMGFCPNADFENRLDERWKEKGVCCFDYEDSKVQLEKFNTICPGDLVVLKKREKFGKTMNLYGHGRVQALAIDDRGLRYLKMDWSNQDQVIEVPLMACADSSPKCNSSESSFGVEEHFMGCSVAQRLSWSMIESVHDKVNLLISDRIEPPVLGNVLPYQSIGVFV